MRSLLLFLDKHNDSDNKIEIFYNFTIMKVIIIVNNL